MTPMRTVRHLQLRAPDEQWAHRAVLLLEDALRTASLHDEGGRLILVRKLPLGRIASDTAPQSVALALERAVAEVTVECVHGAHGEAAGAGAVWFRDTTEAYTLLALRLLDGRRTDAWYWPLAVPAWQRSAGLADNLRRLAFALAARDDAPAALPRWLTAIADAGYAARLTEAFSHAELRALANAAQIPPPPPRQPQRAIRPGVRGARRRPEPARTPTPEPLAEALHALVLGAYRMRGKTPTAVPDIDTDRLPAEHQSAVTGRDQRRPGPALPQTRTTPDGRAIAPAPDGKRPPRTPIGQRQSPPPAATTANQRNATASLSFRPVHAVPSPHCVLDADGLLGNWPAPGEPTIAGGLFFIVHVLDRCGYRDWLEAQPEWQDHPIALRVLEQILTRLRVNPADPIRSAVLRLPEPRRTPRCFLAPQSWHEGLSMPGPLRHTVVGPRGMVRDARGRLLLAAWRGSRPRAARELLTATIPDAGAIDRIDAAAVADAWLIACRRWLRRYAHIGLADTVLRSAEITLSATHIDLWFEHTQADPRIRRTGLDLDPGWVPWLRRVVGFHYGPSWPLGT